MTALAALALGGCDKILGLRRAELFDAGTGGACSNGQKDANETDVDCGGACQPCADHEGCLSGADCLSHVCEGGTCIPSACDDKVKNGNETDIDCGGNCPPCAAGGSCGKDADCKGASCVGGHCEATCTDGAQDGAESDVDCGMACGASALCADGKKCGAAGDCQSGVCLQSLCAGNYPWAHGYGDSGTTSAVVMSSAADASDNIILAGVFDGTINFGSNALTAGGTSIFLAKFNAAGDNVWSFKYDDGSGTAGVSQVVTDAAGDIFITGSFKNQINFGFGCAPLSTSSGVSAFLVKLDAFGTPVPQWCKVFGIAGGGNSGRAVAIDSADNVFLTGVLGGKTGGSADFGGGTLTSAGQQDVFLAKFDAAGNYKWAKRFGDADIQSPSNLVVDAQDGVVLSGAFRGSIDFGMGALASAGDYDVFLTRFDPGGAVTWNHQFGDGDVQIPSGMVIDGAGRIFLAGTFSGTIDLADAPLTSMGSGDLFLAQLDGTGHGLWSKRFGDASNQGGVRLALDPSGNPILLSTSQGTLDFGGLPLTSAGGPSGGQDIFLAKFRPDGTHVWSNVFGDAQAQYGGALAVDPSAAVIIGGNFGGAMSFGANKLSSTSGQDVFLAKLLLP
jgi:hypothetical protein